MVKDVKDHIGEVNKMVCPPEARVDWEKEASEIWAKILEAKSWQGMTEMQLLECLHSEWFTVVSAAFEKGREAR